MRNAEKIYEILKSRESKMEISKSTDDKSISEPSILEKGKVKILLLLMI
jgi:hypothetical protein